MTNNYKIARFATLLLVFFAFLTQSAKAQLFTDQFNYTTTGTLAADSLIKISGTTSGPSGNSVWKGHSGYTVTPAPVIGIPINPQLQTATSLTYATYPALGGAVSFTNTGLDVNATFASQTTGTVYASAIVSLSATQATGDYFFHLGQTTSTPTVQAWNVATFTGRVFAKSSGTGFVLGFTRGSAATAASYGTTVYPFNTPIFIVIKHNIVTGATNDTVAMYVFTTGLPPTTEPTTSDFTDGGTVADPTEISKIAIRQGTAANAPTGLVDYVRVGTAWADVTSAGATLAPTIAITQAATAIPTANSPAFAMGSVATSTNLDVTFTITNAGTAPLTFTAPTITGTGYSILTPPTSPVANGASNTTTFVVRFNSATAVAGALGTVTIGNNANTSYVVNLSATATAASTPSIAITQGATAISTGNTPAFAMGSVAINTNLDVTFTIINAGTAPLTITTPITITGSYAITQPATSVPNGGTTTFVVRFNSATVVTGSLGTVTIPNNAGADYIVNLSANATAAPTPSIAITQGATAIATNNSPAFSMGSIVAGSNLDATFTITNAGTAPLAITTPIGITGTGFIVFTQPSATVANGTGNTTTFVVRFNSATAVAGVIGIVSIANNAGANYVINLSANATAPVVSGADYEPFNQASGFVSTTNGWVAHGGTGTAPIFTQQTSISASTLLYTGLSTPAGNKATIVAGNTEDINKALTAPISADAYYSTLVNIPNTTAFNLNTTNGEYFMHLANGSGSVLGVGFVGRLYVRQGSVANTFNIGVLNTSSPTPAIAVPTYSTVDYAVGTTYFVVVKYVVSSNTASIWINPATGLTTEPTTTLTNNSGTTPAPANVGSIAIRQSGSATIGTGNVEIDEIRVGTTWASVTPGVSTSPTLTVSPTSLAFGNVLAGANSVAQSYVLTGVNLTNDVTITAPAEFAISATAGGTYGATLTYTLAQMATPQTVFVRASPLTVGAKTGNITHISTGVTTTPSVALTATGTSAPPTPTLTVAPASRAFGNVIVGTNSVEQSYVLTGASLTNDVTITAPAEFAISTTATGTFTSTLTFTVVQMATPQTVFVRASPLTVGSKAGNITHASTGVATLPTVALTATGIIPTLTTAPASLAFGDVVINTSSLAKSYVLSAVTLTNSVTITAPAEFQISETATGIYVTTLTYTVAQMGASKIIFVRASPTTLGAKTGNITHTSTGVANLPIVALTATSVLDNITAGPNLDFGTASTGSFSDVKTFSVQGTSLTSDLVVTAPTNFQVSKDGITFVASLTFTAAEVATIGTGKTVTARFAPTSGASGLKSAVITVTSVGSLTKNVNVTGTETSPTTALDNSFAKEVVVYPNPAQTSFQIKLPTTSKIYVVEIVDISGKVILTKKSDEIISVENLQKGFYFVKFSNAERTFTKKISIN